METHISITPITYPLEIVHGIWVQIPMVHCVCNHLKHEQSHIKPHCIMGFQINPIISCLLPSGRKQWVCYSHSQGDTKHHFLDHVADGPAHRHGFFTQDLDIINLCNVRFAPLRPLCSIVTKSSRRLRNIKWLNRWMS